MESFYPMTERLPWSRSIPGQKDSPGVVLSQGQDDSPGVVPIPGQINSPVVNLSQDKMTPMESFYPPDSNDSPGVVLFLGHE